MSVARLRRRAAYREYMASAAWWTRRRDWHAHHVTVTGSEPRCAGCLAEWSLDDDDLHHLDYTRLGDEAHADLIAVCRACHDVVHWLYDSSRAYRRLGLRTASLTILQRIRAGRA
ncbi:MAG: hypothetical protein QM621_08075 [Aeromicrobium sp.]|uniref:hypothetical protein n=1 Tax=Aeromicrobium sp. TaxID=1871063 RepID=UPI0039E2D076